MEPTEKQLKAINNIENVLNVKFEGSTKKEAWLWMQEYIPKFEEAIKQLPPLELKRLVVAANSADNIKLEFMDHVSNRESGTFDKESLDADIAFYSAYLSIF